MKIYMAGSLFSEGEQIIRKHEGEAVRETIADLLSQASDIEIKGEDLIGDVVFNPIENPFNDKSTLPTSEAIYKGDKEAIDKASIFFFNLDNITDAGVFMELGQVMEKIEKGARDIYIYPTMTDMRIATSGEYDGVRVPWGFNQYVVGALLANNIEIYKSFSDALTKFAYDHLDNAFVIDGRETFKDQKTPPISVPLEEGEGNSFKDGDKAILYMPDGSLVRYKILIEDGQAHIVRGL